MTTPPPLSLSSFLQHHWQVFNTPLLLLLHHRLRSPSLCGTPRALSGLKYDMITASTTITQQCGRIVAASGAATPSERRCRLSVSSSLLSSRHGLCCLRAHAVCVSLPPPPLLTAFLPIIKSVSLPSLLSSPPPPPPPLPCSNPQLNTVWEMLYCALHRSLHIHHCSASVCVWSTAENTTTRYFLTLYKYTYFFLPPCPSVLEGCLCFSPPPAYVRHAHGAHCHGPAWSS